MIMQGIRKKQIDLLDKIHVLQKSHPYEPSNGSRCLCDICEKTRELGKEYERLSLMRKKGIKVDERKIKSILAKGEDATRSEIDYLIRYTQMTKREAAKELGIPNYIFMEVCKNWGIGRIHKEDVIG